MLTAIRNEALLLQERVVELVELQAHLRKRAALRHESTLMPDSVTVPYLDLQRVLLIYASLNVDEAIALELLHAVEPTVSHLSCADRVVSSKATVKAVAKSPLRSDMSVRVKD